MKVSIQWKYSNLFPYCERWFIRTHRVWAIPGGTQALHSRTTPGGFRGPYVVTGTKPGSTVYKASTFPTISLVPGQIHFKKGTLVGQYARVTESRICERSCFLFARDHFSSRETRYEYAWNKWALYQVVSIQNLLKLAVNIFKSNGLMTAMHYLKRNSNNQNYIININWMQTF